MTPSKVFLYPCLSFIAGIFIASFVDVPRPIIWEFFILGIFWFIFSYFISRNTQEQFRNFLVIFAICLIFLSFGVLWKNYGYRMSIVFPQGIFEGMRQELREIIYENMSPPQSSILAAIVLGDKGKISSEWKEKLNISGARHITAISGMHIVILSQILILLGIAIGLYRGQAFYFALVFLWLFIIFIGFQPSAVRAGIMGSLFLFSQKIGRQKAGLNALVLACLIMLLFNPMLLRDNLGFQLSFLAVLGIMYLMPIFKKLLDKAGFLKTLNISGLLAMSFAAQVFTLPILIYNFGYVSLASPLTNILIVPFLPYIMVSGFLFLIAGLIYAPLAWVLSLPAWLLLNYLTGVVEYFSKISFASISFKVPWFCVPLFYIILGYFIWRLAKKRNNSFSTG